MGRLRRNKDGHALCSGVGAVTGDYPYLQDNRIEYVSEAALSNKHSLQSAIGKDVVLEHNDKKVGTIDYMSYEDGKVLVDFTITDEEAIEAIESGKLRELSFQHKSESHKVVNQDYTHVQGLREYSHLAVVEVARGGANCSILINNED